MPTQDITKFERLKEQNRMTRQKLEVMQQSIEKKDDEIESLGK